MIRGPRWARTRTLVATGRDPFQQHGFVNPPTYRGSTVLYPNAEDLFAHRGKYSYGRRGSPTIDALAGAINELEGAAGTVLTPSGLSAVTTAMLSAVRAGDHFLVVDSAYNPGRHFCDTTLKDFGVETTYYDPLIGAGIADLFRPNTKAILTESPGSLTFDVQDIPAIVEVAHKAGILVLMDNTWATPLFFKPLDHGADISIQAGTKYISGHSDIMIGTVSANRDAWPRLHNTHGNLGLTVGPDDISLALRGLRTMGIRLARHQETAFALARWLQSRPEVAQVMHPGLEIRSRPCDLEARLLRRVGSLRLRAPRRLFASGYRALPQLAHALRHGLFLGRLRKPHHSLRHPRPFPALSLQGTHAPHPCRS